MDYVSGWCQSAKRLEGCTAIVTGANAGIGKETVYDFYMRGARVIMACRNLNKARDAKLDIEQRTLTTNSRKGTLLIEKLDVSSLESVREFSKRVLASEKCVQILVNNAGVMCCPEGRTEDGFETHIGTNHFGHALLTLLLLPRLIESGPSRVVFVSSAIHYFCKLNFDDINYTKTPYDPLAAYSRSKIANVIFARALAQKLKDHDIKDVTTYSLHPGIVYTHIARHLETSRVWASRIFHFSLLRWAWKSPRCGAQTTIYCAVDENCANESGLYYSDCASKSPSSHCCDDDNVTKLWDHTIKSLFPHYKTTNLFALLQQIRNR